MRAWDHPFFEQVRCPISQQTLLEEAVNAFTHRVALGFSIVALLVMVGLAATFGQGIHIVATSAFCVSLILLFWASVMYHSAEQLSKKRLYRMLDHMAIFLVIAGSYTPFMLVLHDQPLAWPLFWTMWALALGGVALKIFFTGRFVLASTLMYVGMGWLGVLVFQPLSHLLSEAGFSLLVAGGIAYTVGAAIYMWRSLPYQHSIWHLFTMLGATCHYFAVVTILVA